MSDAIQIFVFKDGAYVGSEVFTEPDIVIGHGPEAQLSLEDERVLGRHAMLSHDNGQASLLKLAQGEVLVNRARVDHTYVSARDEIQIGGYTLKIKFLAPKAASARPAAAPRREPRAPSVLEQHAGFGDELHAEAMTEVINTSPPVAPHWPDGQRPRGGAEVLIQDEIGRAISQVTGSIAISGSDVVSSQPVSDAYSGEAKLPRARDQRRGPERKKEPERAQALFGSGPGVENVWAETSQPETMPADGEFASVEQALDSTFSAIPAPSGRSEVPRPGYEPKVPKARVPPASKSDPGKPVASTKPAPRLEETRALGAAKAPPARDVATLEVRDGGKKAGASPVPRGFAESPEHTAPRMPLPSPAELAPRAPEPRRTPAPALGAAELDLDEAYERDLDERPAYTLFPLLVEQKDARTNLPAEQRPVLEIIAANSDAVEASLLVRKGERAVLGEALHHVALPSAGQPGLKLARVDKDGEAELEFPANAEGHLEDSGARTPLDQLKRPENAVSKKGNTFRAKLKSTGSATVQLGETTFHLRFVRPPVPPSTEELHVDRQIPRALGASLVVHFLALVITAIISPGVSYSEGQREMWSDVKQDEVREVKAPEPPPPPPPEEPPPEPTPEEEPPPPEEKAPKLQPKERPGKKEGKATVQKGFSKEEVKSAGVLGALGKLNLAAPGPKSMVQAATNLDAVHAPGGSNFKVGALVGKMPVSGVSVGGGGGGGPITKGGAELIRGGEGLAQLGKRGGGTVRGKVGTITPSKIEARGSISREEVAAVINQHLREVQYCYEKTLLKDPGLAGKLILEWVINVDGSVGKVKEKLSTLKNPAVSQCISDNLRRWQFPKPRGGIVIVSYPFIFNAVGF